MKVNVITAFPLLIKNFFNNTIIKKAIEKNILDINIIDLRDFSINHRKNIDDSPFGGGNGMVIKVEPLYNALNSLNLSKEVKIIYTSPQGIQFNHEIAKEFSSLNEITIICGHYEGIDDRIMDLFDVTEISIGDYVLSGGELPSLVIIDAVLRLVPEVIKEDSRTFDSFYDNLLDYPSYSRPQEFQGKKVPDVLVSGNHAEIEKWRKKEKIKRTFFRRPELLKGNLKEDEKKYLKDIYEDILKF